MPQGWPTGAAIRACEFRRSATLYFEVAKGSKPTIGTENPPGCAARQRSRTFQHWHGETRKAELKNQPLLGMTPIRGSLGIAGQHPADRGNPTTSVILQRTCAP